MFLEVEMELRSQIKNPGIAMAGKGGSMAIKFFGREFFYTPRSGTKIEAYVIEEEGGEFELTTLANKSHILLAKSGGVEMILHPQGGSFATRCDTCLVAKNWIYRNGRDAVLVDRNGEVAIYLPRKDLGRLIELARILRFFSLWEEGEVFQLENSLSLLEGESLRERDESGVEMFSIPRLGRFGNGGPCPIVPRKEIAGEGVLKPFVSEDDLFG